MTEQHEHETIRPNSAMIFVLAVVLALVMAADAYVGMHRRAIGREARADTMAAGVHGARGQNPHPSAANRVVATRPEAP